MPFGHDCEYETFDACVRDQMDQGHDQEAAENICGRLKADTEEKCQKGCRTMKRYTIKHEQMLASEYQLNPGGRILGFTKAESDEGDEDVFNVSGVIGDGWDGLTSSQMVPMIQNSGKPLRFRMNTPGGFVHESLDIYDAMINHPHNVTVDIVAMAWSAGTILSAGADETRIAPAAKYGLHRCWSGMMALGNADELRGSVNELNAMIDSLEKLDLELAGIISDRTNASLKQVEEWMIGPEGCDGTEFIGREAVEAGLVDSLIETRKKKKEKDLAAKAHAQKQMLQILKGRAGITAVDAPSQTG